MRFTPDNFLYLLRQVVTGGGKLSVTPFGTNTPQASALPAADSGINEDVVLSLGDATLGSTTAFVTDSQGLRALQTNVSSTQGSTNTTGTFSFIVPRDYDVTADKLLVRVQASMTGNTDTPTISIASSTLLPAGTMNADGRTLNLTATLVNGKSVNGTTVTQLSPLTISSTLSSTQSIYEFDLSGLGLIRDTVVSLKLTTSNHNTDKVNVYGVSIVYAWTIVAFNDAALGNDPSDLVGSDAFGNPLR
jgi:hypothetical protein